MCFKAEKQIVPIFRLEILAVLLKSASKLIFGRRRLPLVID